MILKGKTSSFRIENQEKIFVETGQYNMVNNSNHPYHRMVNVNNDRSTYYTAFPMPKKDIKITLNVGLNVWDKIEIRDYGQGEILLDAGTYNFELRGADGGHGGRLTNTHN